MEANYTQWGYADATKIDKISPIPIGWTLWDLFYNLAERTQSFPSDDYPITLRVQVCNLNQIFCIS